MKHSFYSIGLAFALSIPVYAADGDDALFGLKWGMTSGQVKAAGVTLTKSRGERNLDLYKTSSLPKNISDVETYTLIFADDKLVKVFAVSKNLTNDPSGSDAKERFDTLKSAMTEKYGKPTLNTQTVGNKLFQEHDEFYQCLKYSGCGLWASIFMTTEKTLLIQIKGISRGVGYLEIGAEATPQWDKALEIYKSRKNSSDKDAL